MLQGRRHRTAVTPRDGRLSELRPRAVRICAPPGALDLHNRCDAMQPTSHQCSFESPARRGPATDAIREESPVPSDDHNSDYHTPVMVDEVLRWLKVGPEKRFVDGTAGGGGHAAAILSASDPDGQLVAIDRDPEAVAEVRRRLGDAGGRLRVVRANYADTADVLARLGWSGVDGWLVDAGVSSRQIDEPQRGFSFQKEGPLDMRMGPEATTAAAFLDQTSVDELTDVLRDFGEVSGSRRLAGKILNARGDGELETTADLAELVEDDRPHRHGRIHPATLVFQALRIAVNRELDHLRRAVESIPDVVCGGGRAVFISFHSLEDRIVKHGFRRLARSCVCPPDLPRCGCDEVSYGRVLTSGPVQASEREVENNPRARSAKLRAFEVADDID